MSKIFKIAILIGSFYSIYGENVTPPPGGMEYSTPAMWKKEDNCTNDIQCSNYYRLGAKCQSLGPSADKYIFSVCDVPYLPYNNIPQNNKGQK